MQGFGLGLGLSQRGRVGRYSPSILFANGEQGAWYDPSDPTTLFQDATGTVPATADGQPVGLMLDKHAWGGKTLAQVIAGQPELRGGYDISTAGAPVPVATYDPDTGAGSAIRVDDDNLSAVRFINLSVAKYYIMDIKAVGGNSAVYVRLNDIPGSTIARVNVGDRISIYLTGATAYALRTNSANNAFVSFVVHSIKEIPGNHASQVTVSRSRAYKTDGVLHWLLDDGSDDALPVTFGDLGSNCTVAYADDTGVHILTGQTISGVYNLPGTGGKLYGCIIIDRPFTTAETAAVTAWLGRKAGL